MLIFGLDKEYSYNSNIWVNIGDIVIVTGRMKSAGRVIGVKEGWNNQTYMQQVIEVVIPKKDKYY